MSVVSTGSIENLKSFSNNQVQESYHTDPNAMFFSATYQGNTCSFHSRSSPFAAFPLEMLTVMSKACQLTEEIFSGSVSVAGSLNERDMTQKRTEIEALVSSLFAQKNGAEYIYACAERGCYLKTLGYYFSIKPQALNENKNGRTLLHRAVDSNLIPMDFVQHLLNLNRDHGLDVLKQRDENDKTLYEVIIDPDSQNTIFPDVIALTKGRKVENTRDLDKIRQLEKLFKEGLSNYELFAVSMRIEKRSFKGFMQPVVFWGGIALGFAAIVSAMVGLIDLVSKCFGSLRNRGIQ